MYNYSFLSTHSKWSIAHLKCWTGDVSFLPVSPRADASITQLFFLLTGSNCDHSQWSNLSATITSLWPVMHQYIIFNDSYPLHLSVCLKTSTLVTDDTFISPVTLGMLTAAWMADWARTYEVQFIILEREKNWKGQTQHHQTLVMIIKSHIQTELVFSSVK